MKLVTNLFCFFLLIVPAFGQNNAIEEPIDSTIVIEKELSGTKITSSLNKKSTNVIDDDFSFMVSGHFHGASHSASGMPASSLMANLKNINEKKPDFIIAAGDLFLNVERDYKNYEKYLFNSLNVPLFNAVGNHDVDNDTYNARYGETFVSFIIGNNGFILLDTERDNGDIVGDQLDDLKMAIKEMKNCKNLFIFMHRTLWANDELAVLFPDNTQSATATNFENEILPMFEKLAYQKLFLFSGSIGGEAPASFFYHPYSKNITFIASAIRDLPRDGVLFVHCRNDNVTFETFSLNSNKVLPLEKYDIEWWKSHKPETPGFNWRLVPLYIWQMITHRYFWYGTLYIFLPGIILLFILKRRWRGKKT